jgi:hypothetical protein
MPGTGHGENGHRLGKPVDAGPPVLPEQEEDRGNQRARMADSHPEHEVDDREGPRRRAELLPHTPTPVVSRYPISPTNISVADEEIANAMYQDRGGHAAAP